MLACRCALVLDTAARPKTRFAVRVIALVLALSSIALALESFTGTDAPAPVLSDEQGSVIAGALVAVGLAASAGLWLLRRWAWVAAMLWVGVVMTGELLIYFENRDPSFLVMLLCVVFVLYFNRTEVQKAFQRNDVGEDALP